MKCAWNELLSILPTSIRPKVDEKGLDTLQELRLRLGQAPELICKNGTYLLEATVEEDDLHYIINMASQYSPWACATTPQGYITAPGGHRIGICGEAAVRNGAMTGLKRVSSLCVRVARDIPCDGRRLPELNDSTLIIGSPGTGKTTLLRNLIRQRAKTECVGVVDERGELFPVNFYRGMRTDILSACGKPHGIELLLRTMSPHTIAVDEITAPADCDALMQAGWCGVKLFATAHARDKTDLLSRKIYAPLVQTGLFDTLIIMQRDKSWTAERM